MPGCTDCWIIDPSFDPDEVIAAIQAAALSPAAILLTHTHVDHIAGVQAILSAFSRPGAPLPIWVHAAEEAWLNDPVLNLSAMFGMPVTTPTPARLLNDADTLTLGGTTWKVLHTPGHSPGGITLHHAASAQAIVGDTLFNSSVGRTDFPGGDPGTLAHSIRSKLYTLPPETTVYPGHGPTTTIAREMRSNPFVKAAMQGYA